MKIQTQEIAERLEEKLCGFIRVRGFEKVIVGCSGGIDSAVVLAIASAALGSKNVEAITMPSKYSSEGSVNDSIKLCKNLGVKLYIHPILDEVNISIANYSQAFGKTPNRLAIENLQARIRGQILMTRSNDTNALVLNTGNKSEAMVGYFTLHGDGVGAVAPIGDLFKTEVIELAKHYENIPVEIIKKPPSAELWEGQKDEDSLPPYGILDAILMYHSGPGALFRKTREEINDDIKDITMGEISRIIKTVHKNTFKSSLVCDPIFLK